MWGGPISAVSYISQGDYTAKDASTRFSITFTSTGSTAILAWGGHIASRADWGAGNSAGAVSGSSYHTRLISIDGGGGNQDRSLSAQAVVVPPLVCPGITPTSRSVCVGTASIAYTYTPEAGVTYKWTITPGTTAAVLQGAVAGTFTTTSGTVTVVPPAGSDFTAGTFSLNLVMSKVGVTDKTCTFSNVGTVVANPAVYTLSGNAICASAPNTGVITLSNSQTGVSYQLKTTAGNTNTQAAQNGTTGNSLTWTGLPAGVSYYVLATGAAPTSCTSTTGNASVSETANPAAPAVTYNAPACDATTFSVTIGSAGNPVIAGASYSIVDKNGAAIANVSPASPHVATASEATNGFSFSNIPAGSGYRVTVSAASCGSSNTSCGASTLRQATGTNTQTTVQQVVVPAQTKVTAYPNPFSDRVKFVVTSSVAGQGSLEVYNMLGQKLKTVYQGKIIAGNQTFDLALPATQRSNLIYVLRVGDTRITGKLLNINR
jgi:hypothetical protein